MRYDDTEPAIFLRRLNRFVAECSINGVVCRVHVRNTSRCTSVISAGAEVCLQHSSDPARKTAWTLISVNTAEYGWVNLDSLAPNKMAQEWLRREGFTNIRPEFSFGSSRIDFYAERGGQRWLVEAKGCTLARNGTGFFPDAPTSRGARHLRELASASGQGWKTAIAFVIMLSGIEKVLPNADIDPVFAEEFERAKAAGVSVFYIPCGCTSNEIYLK